MIIIDTSNYVAKYYRLCIGDDRSMDGGDGDRRKVSLDQLSIEEFVSLRVFLWGQQLLRELEYTVLVELL